MTAPFGKGARFLVMGGDYRGREGVIVAPVADSPGLWWLNLEGAEIVIEQSDADGPNFKRLADAPPEVDPLFAEVAALEAKRSQFRGGPSYDDRRDPAEWLELVEDEARVECDGSDEIRDHLLECVALALAGIRSIDRR